MERSRGRIRDASLADLAAFALFFPCRVAGPIKRYADFTASVANAELLPQNLTQAQRDYFGAHSYQRNDKGPDAPFVHTEWSDQVSGEGTRHCAYEQIFDAKSAS